MKLYPAAIALFAAYVRAAADDDSDSDSVRPQSRTSASTARNNGQFAVPPSTTITLTRDGTVYTSYAWWLPEASDAYGSDKPLDYATTTDSRGRTTTSPVWWRAGTESAKPSRSASASVASDAESSTGASRSRRQTTSLAGSSAASSGSASARSASSSASSASSASARSASSSSLSDISTTTNGSPSPLRALRALPAGSAHYSAGTLASAICVIAAAALL
ncbi:AAR076Cp [Eremothecium gossypii ATCC 10895]|uniref:AAR076Cp n=1 Tax=Eremothecium gossypii (strain ATCC 10895 / CBS 109.51 / FGSC 9923 / NRRL Y-1056) TaxID=284811 RepID=Q75EK3_EREGS|nr:AAR076Cp [Eremothecium gossypii ATCC 10895]AAS50441.1 AAR076Cp [Eremothecium gossypii ATCC 10895]AEY94727.1 FAAR076Cp [Eremothecium gossypii FDAG1]